MVDIMGAFVLTLKKIDFVLEKFRDFEKNLKLFMFVYYKKTITFFKNWFLTGSCLYLLMFEKKIDFENS